MRTFAFVQAWMHHVVNGQETSDERGASLVEYALLLALLALVCIAAMAALGSTVSTSFSEAVSELG